MKRLEHARYRLSENKTELVKTETEWVSFKNRKNGIGLQQHELKALQVIREPKNEKELKAFLSAIQCLSKYIENLSAQTDLRQLVFVQNSHWTTEHSEAFIQSKKKITEIPVVLTK